jgi:hypothetical protein
MSALVCCFVCGGGGQWKCVRKARVDLVGRQARKVVGGWRFGATWSMWGRVMQLYMCGCSKMVGVAGMGQK